MSKPLPEDYEPWPGFRLTDEIWTCLPMDCWPEWARQMGLAGADDHEITAEMRRRQREKL